jgi:hypothetical protein
MFYEIGSNVIGVLINISLIDVMLILTLIATLVVAYLLKGHKLQVAYSLATMFLGAVLSHTMFMIYHMNLWLNHSSQWVEVLWFK